MGRLLTNELAKVSHRWSFRIMALLMIIAAVGMPVMAKLTFVMHDSTADNRTEKWFKALYEQEDGAKKEMYKTVVEEIADLKEKGIDIEGWRRNYFFNYLTFVNTMTALNLIQQGNSIEDCTSGIVYGPLIHKGLNSEFYFLHITEFNGLYGYRSEEILFKKEDIPKYIEDIQPYYDYTKQLLCGDKEKFVELKTEELKGRIADTEKQIEELSVYEADMREKEMRELALVAYEGGIKCWEAFKACDTENEEWIAGLENLLSRMAEAEASDAAAFHKEYFYSEERGKYDFYREVFYNKTMSFDSYEEYTEFMKEAKEDFGRAVDMIVYSAENQTPTEESVSISFKSAKYVLEESLNVTLYTVMFFCIFLSAIIMANEYTSGSIRLLLIRPRPRWKILFSKLLCLWIYTAAALLAAFGLTLLTTTLIYGGGDLGTQIVAYKNGAITAVYPLQVILRKELLKFISMFGISMLAFMLGIIIKKGTVAAAAGVLVFGFGKSASEFIRYGLYKLPFLKYTVLPYIMNLENTEYSPLERFMSYNAVSADFGLELPAGIFIITLHTAVFAILSFVIFDRQQIKN